MWNLISQGTQSTVYRPTASSGTVTSPANAYDVDAYPWSTSSTQTNTGSAVAGTTDNLSVSFTTFPTLAKTAFSTAILHTVISFVITPYNNSTLKYLITSGLSIEYSTDGGSTWTLMSQYGTNVRFVGDESYSPYMPPAIDLDYSSPPVASIPLTNTVTKQSIYATVPSTAFSVGLQNLQIRFTTSTLKSTRAGNPQSAVSYQVWDVQAVVS